MSDHEDSAEEFKGESYAVEKGEELQAILAEVAFEFATTAQMKLSEPPQLHIKHSDDQEIVSLTKITLDHNQDQLDKEYKKQKEAEQKALKGKPSWNRREKEDWEVQRDAAVVEQLQRLEPLRNTMPQAAFGHGSKTLQDKTVRDALQLPAERFEIKVSLENKSELLSLDEALAVSGVLKEVQENLGIDSEHFDLVAEQYSLNLYNKCGHFKKHKDTPRGSDMVGTLLVQLPGAYYEGGALEISVGDGLKKKLVLEGQKRPYSYWGQKVEFKLPDPKELHIAAFFCDIDHEVLLVEEGTRLTAAFLLRVKNKTPLTSVSSDLNKTVLPKRLNKTEQETALTAKLVELCNDENFLPVNPVPIAIDVTSSWISRSGGDKQYKNRPTFLAVPCFHLYSNTQVFSKKKESAEVPLTVSQVAALKGKDAILGKAVLAAGEKTGGSVKVFLQPMVGHTFSGEEYEGIGEHLMSKFPTPKMKMPYRISDDGIVAKFKCIGTINGDVNAIWVFDQEKGHEGNKVGESEWNAEGYFGNEASWTEFYVKSFLKVEFEPYEKRKKLIEEAAKQPEKENKKPAPKRRGQGKGRTPAKKSKITESLFVERGTSP